VQQTLYYITGAAAMCYADNMMMMMMMQLFMSAPTDWAPQPHSKHPQPEVIAAA
jgi:hypothetical protein